MIHGSKIVRILAFVLGHVCLVNPGKGIHEHAGAKLAVDQLSKLYPNGLSRRTDPWQARDSA
jgi:hypothetical protein